MPVRYQVLLYKEFVCWGDGWFIFGPLLIVPIAGDLWTSIGVLMIMKSLSICGTFSSNSTFAQLWCPVGNYMIAPNHKIVDSRSKNMPITYEVINTNLLFLFTVCGNYHSIDLKMSLYCRKVKEKNKLRLC